VTGQTLMTAGLVIITLAIVLPGGFAGVIIGMVVGEAGFMLGSVACTIAATSSMEDRHAGLAAGLLNTATQLGGGLGLGIVSAVAATRGEPASSAQVGFIACLVFAAAALLLTGRMTPEIEPSRRVAS
jgi:MFS family permease